MVNETNSKTKNKTKYLHIIKYLQTKFKLNKTKQTTGEEEKKMEKKLCQTYVNKIAIIIKKRK